MAEESVGERTEEATPRRRAEARERGHVARSVDLSAAVILLVGLSLLYVLTPRIIADLSLLMRLLFEGSAAADIHAGDLRGFARLGAAILSRSFIPYALVLFIMSLSVNLLQTGFVLSAYPLRFDLDKMNPISGFRRILSVRGGVRFLMSIMKIVVVATVAYLSFRSELKLLPATMELEIGDLLKHVVRAGFFLGIRMALALLLLGLLDYLYQRWQYERDLRMTRQEIRDEMKKMEGDPLMRQRRRAIQRQLAMQRMMHRVPEADVVITNPVHIAVALLYQVERMNAPRVVAKGAGEIANRIVELAEDSNVPLVENVPLAQALYRSVSVGQEIPPELYVTVAEVLAYVYQLEGERRPAAAV